MDAVIKNQQQLEVDLMHDVDDPEPVVDEMDLIEIMDVVSAAKFLKVSVSTMFRRNKDRSLVAIRGTRGRLVYIKDMLMHYRASNRKRKPETKPFKMPEEIKNRMIVLAQRKDMGRFEKKIRYWIMWRTEPFTARQLMYGSRISWTRESRRRIYVVLDKLELYSFIKTLREAERGGAMKQWVRTQKQMSVAALASYMLPKKPEPVEEYEDVPWEDFDKLQNRPNTS